MVKELVGEYIKMLITLTDNLHKKDQVYYYYKKNSICVVGGKMDKNNLLAKYKVLYVEDDSTHREELKIFLKRRVGKLYLAADGMEGLEIYKQEKPDIIISDLRMPNMDGIELSKEIRKIDKICPIIITTAFSDVETILGAVDVGIDKYVLKPIDTKELVGALEEVAIKCVEIKNDETFIANNTLIRDRKDRLEYEGKLQIKIASYIKSSTGKGPKNVRAFIRGNEVEIEIKESLTLLEKSVMKSSANMNLVKFFRETFYKAGKKTIEEMVNEVLGVKFQLEVIECDILSNRDILKGTIK